MTTEERQAVRARIEREYSEGADYAFYELCKNLDIKSEDIRKSGDTIDGIAARLAERIRDVFETPEDSTALPLTCEGCDDFDQEDLSLCKCGWCMRLKRVNDYYRQGDQL